jgi:hypothetical protein
MRCSSLPRALTCPASVLRESGEIVVQSDDEFARLGTAFHAYIGDHIEGDRPTVPIEEYADIDQVDAEELSILCAQGRECWDSIRSAFPAPIVEEYLEEPGELGLTGTPDVVSVVDVVDKVESVREVSMNDEGPMMSATARGGRQARILDWKTGWGEQDHSDQLKGYAYLACLKHGCDRAWVAVVRVRDCAIVPAEYTREELAAWYQAAVNKLTDDPVYVPGEACMYCPRSSACQAKTELLAQASHALMIQSEEADLAHTRPEQLVRLNCWVRHVGGFLETVKKLIKAEVASRGGKIETPDGDGLEIVRQERKTLDTAKAWPILLPMIGLDSLVSASKLGKGDVEDAIKATVAKGKGKAVEAAMDKLDEAGAIRHDETEILMVRKSLKPITHEATQ